MTTSAPAAPTTPPTGPDTAPIRKAIVRVTIGCFSLAALLGIVALLSGGFGETQGRVLLTTLLVGVVSIAVLCFVATGGRPSQPVGLAGGIVVLVPLVSGLVLIWSSWDDGTIEATVKVFGTGAVVAATLAQACLLLILGERARPGVRRLLAGTLALAAVLAGMICALILELDADSDGYYRLVGVVAILDVLGTVVVAALMKFGNGETDRVRADFHLPADLATAVAELAATSGRSGDEVVSDAVRRYLDGPA